MQLQRTLGLGGGIALAIGSVAGSGILFLPSVIYRLAEHDAAGVGQLQRTPAAGRTVQDGRADDAFERADLLADRGLRVAEMAGGGGERALVDDGRECPHVAHLQRAPAISVAHRS